MRETNITFVDLTTEIGKRRAVKKFLEKPEKQAYISGSFLIIIWGVVFWIIVNIADHVILSVTIALVISVWLVRNISSYIEELQYLQKILKMESKFKQIMEFIEYGKKKDLTALEIQLNEKKENLANVKIPPYVDNLEVSQSEHDIANVKVSYKKE